MQIAYSINQVVHHYRSIRAVLHEPRQVETKLPKRLCCRLVLYSRCDEVWTCRCHPAHGRWGRCDRCRCPGWKDRCTNLEPCRKSRMPRPLGTPGLEIATYITGARWVDKRGGVLFFTQGRNILSVDPHIRAVPGQIMLSVRRQGRYCLRQARNPVRWSMSRMNGYLHPTTEIPA